jgi:hypothetical protein
MDDERWEPGMPVLDRQPVGAPAAAPAAAPVAAPPAAPSTPRTRTLGSTSMPASLLALPPRSVPEVAPTPLGSRYVSLSVVVLICGALAITALELGAPLGSPLVKLPVALAAPLLIITTADAVVRIWRSAWAWMPIDRGRGLFRLAWVIVSLTGLAALTAASVAVVRT